MTGILIERELGHREREDSVKRYRKKTICKPSTRSEAGTDFPQCRQRENGPANFLVSDFWPP